MTRVEVDMDDDTLRDLIVLSLRKRISRTEALAQAVHTALELYECALEGFAVLPLPEPRTRRTHRAPR